MPTAQSSVACMKWCACSWSNPSLCAHMCWTKRIAKRRWSSVCPGFRSLSSLPGLLLPTGVAMPVFMLAISLRNDAHQSDQKKNRAADNTWLCLAWFLGCKPNVLSKVGETRCARCRCACSRDWRGDKRLGVRSSPPLHSVTFSSWTFGPYRWSCAVRASTRSHFSTKSISTWYFHHLMVLTLDRVTDWAMYANRRDVGCTIHRSAWTNRRRRVLHVGCLSCELDGMPKREPDEVTQDIDHVEKLFSAFAFYMDRQKEERTRRVTIGLLGGIPERELSKLKQDDTWDDPQHG